MEIFLILEVVFDWIIMDFLNISEFKNGQDLSFGFYLDDEIEDVVDEYNLYIDLVGLLVRVR